MPRVLATLALLALLFPLAGGPRAEEDPPALAIWRSLLDAENDDERMDLTEDLLGAEPDPGRLAAILARGRVHDAVSPGWMESAVPGPDGKDRPYLVRVPRTYDASRPHPVLVVLHDRASRTEVPGRAELEKTAALWTAAADEDGIILVLPTSRGGEEWWTVGGLRNLSEIVRRTRKAINVDEDRVFATGIGDGADGVYTMALAWPSTFAGFLPVGSHPVGGARGGHQVHLRNLGCRPMFAVAFEKDETVSPGSAPAMLRAIEKLKLPFTGRTVPDVTGLPALLPEIREWMRTIRRDPAPRRIFWEGNYGTSVDWIGVARPRAVGNDDGGFRDENPAVPPVRPLVGFSSDTTFTGPGIKILSVGRGSAAGESGLAPGDILLGLGDIEIRDIIDLRRAVVAAGFGKKVRLRYRRGEATLEGEGKLSYGVPGPIFASRRPYASLRATVKDNVVDVFVRHVASFEVRLLPSLFDLSKPVVVRVNGKPVHEKVVEPDTLYMVERALLWPDRTRIPRQRLLIRVPGTIPVPAAGAATAGPMRARITEILKVGSPSKITDALLELIEENRGKHDLSLAYVLLFDVRYVRSLPEDPLDLAKRLLLADAKTTAAWSVLSRCRKITLDGDGRDTGGAAAMADLRSWLRDLGQDEKATGEVAVAAALLAGQLDLDEGLPELARSKINPVIDAGEGSPALLEAAEDLLRKTRHLAVGGTAPVIRLPGLAEGTAVRSEDLEGRALLVLFDAGDGEAVRLRDVAVRYGGRMPAYEAGVVVVPLVDEPLVARIHRSAGATVGKAWHAAAYDAGNAEAAKAWGVHTGSAMFLVGPDRRVLKNTGWDLQRSLRELVELSRGEMGTPLPVLLRELRKSGWERFREVWRGLAGGRIPLAAAQSVARSGGERGVWALRLAAAARGERLADGGQPSSSLHGKLVDAWCEVVSGGQGEAWSKLVAPLGRASGEERLAVVEAIYDLGIDREPVREALEPPAVRWRDWRIVSMALRALSHQDTPADPRRLLKHKRAKRWQVRLALAEALEGYRHQGSVDALVDLLGDRSLRVRGAAAVSLEGLTGRDLGVSQKRWAQWRRGEGRGAALIPRRRAAGEAVRRSSHEYAADAYFGLKIASRKIAFVLDKSESMYYGLFDRVVEEVEDFLGSAGPTTSFTVIEFDDQPRLWAKTLMPANEHNIGAVASFLRRSKPTLATNIMDSMALAFSLDEVDTIVLLSDGMPNRGKETDPRAIIEKLTGSNRYSRVAIHTIWMDFGRRFPHDGPRGDDIPPLDEGERQRRRRIRESSDQVEVARFLMELAARNDGTFGVAFADSWSPPPGAGRSAPTDR